MNGIQRIQAGFSAGKAFIGYLTAGDGGIDHTYNAALALIDGGVNVLEIGMPFSDPIADGVVIQRASQRALTAGTTLADIWRLAEKIRRHSAIPLILFSYLNPLLAQSRSNLYKDLSNAGMDGILIVDCPIEESALFYQRCTEHHLAMIQVIAPSTPLSRYSAIANQGDGFLYYACRKGATGIRRGIPEDFADKISAIKSKVDLPVVAGFGIAEHAAAKGVLKYADGVVIGSLFVKALEDGISFTELAHLARAVNPLENLLTEVISL